MKIKVCGITRETDAQKACSLGATHLGFILHPASPRCLPLFSFRKIMENLKGELIHTVAVEVNPDPEELLKIMDSGFDFFQLHFSISTEKTRVMEWSRIVGKDRLWLAPRISPTEEFPISLLPFADTFLIDAYSSNQFGGTGKTSDWSRFKEWKKLHPEKNWLLAGGLGHQNIADALDEAQPDGVDLNSAVEESPGKKCHQKLEQSFSVLLQ